MAPFITRINFVPFIVVLLVSHIFGYFLRDGILANFGWEKRKESSNLLQTPQINLTNKETDAAKNPVHLSCLIYKIVVKITKTCKAASINLGAKTFQTIKCRRRKAAVVAETRVERVGYRP